MSLDPPETFTENLSHTFLDRLKKIIELKNEKFRKKYRELAVRKRRERVKTLGNDVIAMCMDSSKVLSSFDSYLKNDVNLAIYIKMLLDDCQDYLCMNLWRKLSDIPDNIPTPDPTHVASALLCEMSGNALDRIHGVICKDLNI